MIVIQKRKFGFVAYQKWFPKKIEIKDCLLIVNYKQVVAHVKSFPFFFAEKSYTLHSNLTLVETEIFRKFGATIKNEVRRAEKEKNCYNANETIDNFLMVYNDLALHKGLTSQSNRSLSEYGSNLLLTSTSIDNVITAVHSYLMDYELKTVRLLHSATLRFSEQLDKRMVARSNKYLHFKDMIEFKNKGFEIYDWGGIAFGTDDESLQGINKFYDYRVLHLN
jgi:hypothetical protein